MAFLRKIKAGLVKIDRTQFVGEDGNIFFDIDSGAFFLSDGVTPGGIPLGAGGGGGLNPGDNVSLLTNDALYVSQGDNISLLTNDSGYYTLSDINNTSLSALLDVDDDLPTNVQEDSVLIYNVADNEFVAESFVSIVERLRTELEVMYDRLIDEDGAYTYIGEAEPGTTKGQALWRIKRVEELTGVNNGDIEILWADGSAAFDKIWNDRATFTYTA